MVEYFFKKRAPKYQVAGEATSTWSMIAGWYPNFGIVRFWVRGARESFRMLVVLDLDKRRK
jgi:hypothetical protein